MQPQYLLCPVRTCVHRIVPDRVGPLHLRPQRCPETALPRPGSDRCPLRYVLYVCTVRVYCTCVLYVCTVCVYCTYGLDVLYARSVFLCAVFVDLLL